MADMLTMLQDNMACLEDMEEERIRMLQKHEEEKEQLREQLEQEWQEERARLAERLHEEKEQMTREMNQFRAECERRMAEGKAETTQKMIEFREACDRKMKEDKALMQEGMMEFRAECEKKMAEVEAEMAAKMNEAKVERERMVAEKAEMTKEMERFQAECEKKMREGEAEMAKKMSESRAECTRMADEKLEMTRKMADFRAELEQNMAREKKEMNQQMNESRDVCRKLGLEKDQMTREMEQFRRESERKMIEEKAENAKKIVASRAECDRLALEKVRMSEEMSRFREDCEQRMEEEKMHMTKRTEEVKEMCENKVEQEKQEGQKRLEEARQQTENQLSAERQITDHIRHALRELPPLQVAMELGDLAQLDEELWKWRSDELPERFGECKGVVEAVVKLARDRLSSWRGMDLVLKEVLKEVERLPGSVQALTLSCQKLFRVLKESQLTNLDLNRSDPKAMERIGEVLLAWQERAMCHSNNAQRAVVNKVVKCSKLGPFDFTDLDICLRLIDRSESGNAEVFLSRALQLVEDPTTVPKDLKMLLSHVETMLFFLKYACSEDLQLTHTEFRKQFSKINKEVASYLTSAAMKFPPGAELVRMTDSQALLDKKIVDKVLKEIRIAPPGVKGEDLGLFREIFYQWALAMRAKFDLLVLPHHTQVVCLLAFRAFLEADKKGVSPHALIAQVGTGEGKSMIIASLAIYVVVALRKKVHIVVDDETLLERDFWTFKRLFDAFEVPPQNGAGPKRTISSVLCVSEDKLGAGKNPSLSARVDPDADICYCEAKHVQSFYASIARGEKRDFEGYSGRVLILDEVDALVIDEEPNEAFVYPNQDLSRMATNIAQDLSRGVGPERLQVLQDSTHPATARVVREMLREWNRAKQMTVGEDFVYMKEAGRYCSLHAGRVNAKAWSLALECRNFQDGLGREILFQERLFVMSRPRVFRKYHRILGLSGSIGSDAERAFLSETYRAVFFEVPPFLKTCRGSPFHEPVPTKLGRGQQSVYVEATPDAQLARVAEVALEARERVPVLIIAKDRGHADKVVEYLLQAGRSRGLGAVSEDVIRCLSRTLYEADPEQWKENLNRATLPVGERDQGRKSWRITVTDPRGGRGYDYRVDDPDADDKGGLLLIPTLVPTFQREWIQFLGRTARQDRKGQYCAVLNSQDYDALATKYQQPLPQQGSEVVDTILKWGDREAAGRIKGSAALYNCGVRVNELCEEVFGKKSELLKNPINRELLVDVCQRLRWMSVQEIDGAFQRIPEFEPSRIMTEAKDLGRPEPLPVTTRRESARGMATTRDTEIPQGPAQPKVVIFCLDWSCSMMSRDTRGPLTRFGVCMDCVKRIFRDQVHERDLVGVVGFGPTVETVVVPTPKGLGGNRLEQKFSQLAPKMDGGTAFFDAILKCLKLLKDPKSAPPGSPRWLVCLTDGDDAGSRFENMEGELVNEMLEPKNIPQNLNMVLITVGRLRDRNVKIIDSWADKISAQGGVGRHVSEKDASAIAKAFEVVAEVLATEVGGATEC